VTQSLTQ